MMRTDFYPHPCDHVRLIETLRSWLLFAGDFVYKVKKPLHFLFSDARSLPKRHQLCQQEVVLNRRLSPDVYLGINRIIQDDGVFILQTDVRDDNRKPHEFAVVMRRLPREQMLDGLVESNGVSVSQIESLVRKIREFHARGSDAKAKLWGSAVAISRMVESNLPEARTLIADTITLNDLKRVARYARHYLVSHQQTLANRVRDGWVREGHGDLRCDLVCSRDEDFVIIGCVEHSEGWRYADVVAELAGLAVDLDLRERRDLADLVRRTCFAEVGEGLPELFRFYQCYRAVLRGKLQTIASAQPSLPFDQRISARSDARRLFALARDYAT